jgi:hypothetical protein
MKRVCLIVGWTLGLALAALVLHWAGRGALAPPPVTDPGRWAGWLNDRSPVVAGFAVMRIVALAALWYIVATAAVGAGLRLIGAASLVRLADRVTIGPVRRMLAGSMSLGLAVSGVVAVAAPALRLPVAAAQQTTTSTTVVPGATVTMHRLGPAEAVQPLVVAQPQPTPTPSAGTDRWTVRPGECFWSIAEEILTQRDGRAPTDAEIVPYWRRLIDANRLELAQRDDPDLIFPGQVFVVPSP